MSSALTFLTNELSNSQLDRLQALLGIDRRFLGQWRIYFDPDADPGHLFVGYVWSHLNTVQYN